MSSTPQDPYGAGDEPDRSSGSTPPPYGSTPPPPPYGSDTPPAYGSDTPPASGSTPPAYGSTPTGGSSAYGSTPAYGGTPAYGSTPPAYGGTDYGTSPSPYGYAFPKNSLAVWSLVLGLLGIFVCGLFTGIPAIVVGHKARRAVAEGQANNPGMATAGIVLGWISTILSLIGVAIVLGLVATGSFTDLQTVDPSSF